MIDELNMTRMRDEIRRPSRLNDRRNDQLVELREQIAHNQSVNTEENRENVENRVIQSLVDNLRALNIEAKPPQFDDTRNPNEFLGRLEKYYKLKSIPDNGRLNVLHSALEGRLEAWFETQ